MICTIFLFFLKIFFFLCIAMSAEVPETVEESLPGSQSQMPSPRAGTAALPNEGMPAPHAQFLKFSQLANAEQRKMIRDLVLRQAGARRLGVRAARLILTG